MKSLIATVRNFLKPWRVQVFGFCGDWSTVIEHKAWTYEEALDWARCYRINQFAEIIIRTRSLRVVGQIR